ncbi:MAG: hypothetical protein OXF52_01410 [Candidatus Dadabacteria bacterium]|nr:hypothetical protein [Candidatus Dadabacteria bacterium]
MGNFNMNYTEAIEIINEIKKDARSRGEDVRVVYNLIIDMEREGYYESSEDILKDLYKELKDRRMRNMP